MFEKFRLDRKIGLQNTFYTICINVIIDSTGPSIILRSILCYLIVWGIILIFMVRFSFYAMPLLIYDVMNDITIIP